MCVFVCAFARASASSFLLFVVCVCVYESISLTRLIESSITDAVSGLTNK